MSADRKILINRLKEDLIGPKFGVEEEITERPSERYLTGILYPKNMLVQEDDHQESEQAETSKNTTASEDDQGVALFRSLRPATAGLSFAIHTSDGKNAEIRVNISCGTYVPKEASGDEGPLKGKRQVWKRVGLSLSDLPIMIKKRITTIDLTGHGIPGLSLYVKNTVINKKETVTVQLINSHELSADSGRNATEEATFFQVKMSVQCSDNTDFIPRPIKTYGQDDDSRSSALIYRKSKEYATGHTCSAGWTDKEDTETVAEIYTKWMPTYEVQPVSANGDPIFENHISKTHFGNLSAKKIADGLDNEVIEVLEALCCAYEEWIIFQEKWANSNLDESYKEQGEKNIIHCRDALKRIQAGVTHLKNSPDSMSCFKLANRAMQIQSGWAKGFQDWDSTDSKFDLIWRPFQLAFALLTLPSVEQRDHSERDILDLIWFPTGGGKTEAYLLVSAFCLFHRRVRNSGTPEGNGVAVFMRYTLRTLTVQQFQRATSLVSACELIRRNEKAIGLGKERFSIGLWVGNDSTPNSFDDACNALDSNASLDSTPKQLTTCPACQSSKAKLVWSVDAVERDIKCTCENSKCPIGTIPVMTTDDLIYQSPPSLLIGTVDKFAQIVRKRETGHLFGQNLGYEPPDLIIQDELHLIAGPLGSITGLYEAAIDELCTNEIGRPKIIGSTATIRRAKEQVKSLFCRNAFQFPPPGIDEENSCFAMKQTGEDGRLYVGITTAGRSDKYTLQSVSASLLQGIKDPQLTGNAKKYYSTLVAYFNSLRVLGGALVAMQDDVPKTISVLSKQRGEGARTLGVPEELTSRKTSSEIPEILEQLGVSYEAPGFIDILLASNMLSVGVDIPRLGLMVVNGQPKTMSEYIQSTSRVGRSKEGPGLVITLYNNNKIRDRTHYETFKTWHSALYRSVEPSSVTPFSPRARDKALHAPLVAIARHKLGIHSPKLTPKQEQELKYKVIPKLVERIRTVDDREANDAEKELLDFLEVWASQSSLKYLWNDYRPNESLLVSAEVSAARKAAGKNDVEATSTPNSVRNVEPSVDYSLAEYLKVFEE